jgi:hypothetical protein
MDRQRERQRDRQRRREKDRRDRGKERVIDIKIEIERDRKRERERDEKGLETEKENLYEESVLCVNDKTSLMDVSLMMFIIVSHFPSQLSLQTFFFQPKLFFSTKKTCRAFDWFVRIFCFSILNWKLIIL